MLSESNTKECKLTSLQYCVFINIVIITRLAPHNTEKLKSRMSTNIHVERRPGFLHEVQVIREYRQSKDDHYEQW